MAVPWVIANIEDYNVARQWEMGGRQRAVDEIQLRRTYDRHSIRDSGGNVIGTQVIVSRPDQGLTLALNPPQEQDVTLAAGEDRKIQHFCVFLFLYF
ncbi:hypothetical protein KKE87_00805, partial [Patescibacteria group bacterium]|nr:hypothetical protein [Patescibacteria group bacterium]